MQTCSVQIKWKHFPIFPDQICPVLTSDMFFCERVIVYNSCKQEYLSSEIWEAKQSNPIKEGEIKTCMHTVSFKKALVTWMRPNIKSMRVAANKNGPRKLKSAPLFTAQNVYRVKATTTVAVRITARRTLFPVGTKVIHTSDYHMTNQNSKRCNLTAMCSQIKLKTLSRIHNPNRRHKIN